MSTNLDVIKNKKVLVNVGGQNRNIFYDLNAFAELEDAFGDLNKMFDALQRGSVKTIRKFLWAGFIHENEKLTEKEVGSWFDMSGIAELTGKITEALTLAMPPNDEQELPADSNIDPNAQSPIATDC